MIAPGYGAALEDRIRAWSLPAPDDSNAAREFQAIAQTEGIEFATALLHARLAQIPGNAEFMEHARAAQNQTTITADLIGIMPGAFYREHAHTGANGARIVQIAKELGCAAEVIPTGSLGTLAENAQTLRDWLAARADRRIALLSLSKGSADVKHALASAESSREFADVVAWVSLSGLVTGTPLITWLRRRPMRWWSVRLLLWWRGLSARALLELQHGPANPLATWPGLPLNLRVVHVYGFPLAQHLQHPWAPRAHARLSSLGPNDGGGVLLADLLTFPGIVCPIWGADHYLTPAWDAHSLLRGIVAAAVDPRHASQCANPPMAAPAARSSA